MLNEDVYDDQDPNQQSVDIHRTRIIRIINMLIQKIELSVCLDDILPWLGSEKSATDIFTRKSLTQLNRLYSLAKERSRGTKYKTNSSLATISKNVFINTSYNALDRDMIAINTNLIAKLHHSAVVEKSVIDNFIRKQPASIKSFISYMYKLQKHFHSMVKSTETQKNRYRKHVSEAWFKNLDNKEKLKNLRDIHRKKAKVVVESIIDKKSSLKNLEDRINTLNENRIGQCESIVLKSENKMKRKQQISGESQVKLLNEAYTLTKDYQTLLTNNLANEKKLRTKRFKVETVLAQWLSSYDTDIGELQKELEAVQDGYNEIKNKYDILKEDFETQSIQYYELMEEKEAEERRIFEMKLYHIIATRSARIIQRWWRKIHAKKRKKRGKGKKGKGKKKNRR